MQGSESLVRVPNRVENSPKIELTMNGHPLLALTQTTIFTSALFEITNRLIGTRQFSNCLFGVGFDRPTDTRVRKVETSRIVSGQVHWRHTQRLGMIADNVGANVAVAEGLVLSVRSKPDQIKNEIERPEHPQKHAESHREQRRLLALCGDNLEAK